MRLAANGVCRYMALAPDGVLSDGVMPAPAYTSLILFIVKN